MIAALYIDSTEHLGHASVKFTEMLKLTNIPDITINTWGWECAYDRTKLARYWYMANFQQPLYTNNSPFQDVGYVIMQTIQESSKIKLPALCLLDASVNHLCATASSSISLTKNAQAHLELRCTLPSGSIEYSTHWPSEPWITFHLNTHFPQSSIFQSEELGTLEWADTPEQMHIAKARLDIYDPLPSEEHKETKQPIAPQVLGMFLSSKDYSVCTGAFKCWLNLAMPSDSGNVQSPEHGWIKNLIQVLCGSVENRERSWELLAVHLVPKWSTLPPSWCNDFALEFLCSNVHPPELHKLPAYQHLAEGLKAPAENQKTDQLQAFLSFLATTLDPIKLNWDRVQLPLLNNWLAQLPDVPERDAVHAQVETIWAKRQQLVTEIFRELPLADWEMGG